MDSFNVSKTARLAGLFWLLNTFTTAFSMGYVRTKIMVAGDAAATAANLVAMESMFRAGIVSYLASHFFLLLLALTLYRLFRDVDRTWARLLVASMCVAVAVAVVNALTSVGALMVVGPAEYLQTFTAEQRNTLVMVLLRLNNSGVGLFELFWAPFYFSFGWLVVKSRMLPRVLGVLLMLMGVAFLLNTVTKILIPGFYAAQFTQAAMAMGALGGIATILWLLVKGAKERVV